MARTVIAFVGDNQNGILDCQSRRFNALLEPMGLRGELVQLGDAASGARLAALLQGDVAWAWGYAGVGARVTLDGASLWDRMEVPFVSVLADAPYIMPGNHAVATPWVMNGYVYRDWLAFQQEHVRSSQLSSMVPMGVIPNEYRDATRHGARPLRMVFVKSGEDPDARRHRWDDWPARLRPVLHDSAAALCGRRAGPITGVVLECLATHGLDLRRRQPLLFGLLHELDTYVRAVRSWKMAEALLPLPVEVIGDGWGRLAEAEGQARFRPPIAAHELDALYSQAQVLVNVTPNFGSGAHERVLRGFASGCRVVSDENAFSLEQLGGMPSFHGVDWTAADLPDRMAAVFHDLAPFEDRLEPAAAFVRERHDPAAFLGRLNELAELARLSPVMAGYAVEAA